MGKKLTETELNNQYHCRAILVADLIGRHFGSGNKKRAQRVFREPNRWTLWAVNNMPVLPEGLSTGKIRMTIPSPLLWLWLLVTVLIIRNWDKKKVVAERR